MKCTIAVALLVAGAGCEQSGTKGLQGHKPDNPVTITAAENTKNNERDRDSSALTPGDQGENDADRSITQRIRQGVMKEDTLSFSGKNVKIITIDGIVTLRGPVKTVKEKSVIAAIAQRVDGVKRIDNQLDIEAN